MRYLMISALLSLGTASAASAADEPAHTVIRSEGAIEIRDYDAVIEAHVEVEGDRRGAVNAGFRPLAGYIFGGNQSRDQDGAEQIAMTTPVIQSASQRIAMTAPVTQEVSEDGVWRIAFIMPAQWTMETLPVPDNAEVRLVEIPAGRMAAIRFSGRARDADMVEKQAELLEFLAAHDYQVIGEPQYAYYNPPWTLGPFRRNEVMVEVERSD
ncbi:SOUL family heme-binding protein [Maricaulis sp.]|uniref:SOUL family heme-binding protein n=1 Tax=Maricaulis sp. TaxID=1486257 RepID=UPI003A94900C